MGTVQIDRCMTLFHKRYREQSRRLFMLSNHSCGTLVSNNDRCAASSRTNEQTHARICIAFIGLTFSCATIGRLCAIPVVGQTTLDVLGNIKVLARLGPVKRAHMATLSSLFYSV